MEFDLSNNTCTVTRV